jgi:hypothetical protein
LSRSDTDLVVSEALLYWCFAEGKWAFQSAERPTNPAFSRNLVGGSP